jgi:hypothetical protein
MATERTITIELGSQSFEVRQLPIRADAEWRVKAKPLVEPIIEVAIKTGVALPTPDRLAKLAVVNAILYEPLALLDLIMEYAPALEEHRQWIEENAYSDELLAALFVCFLAQTPAPPIQTLARNGVPAPTQPTI